MTTALKMDPIDVALTMSNAMLNANLKGVDERLAATPAAAGANSALWLFGHITYWRSMMVGIAGGEPVWGETEAAEFRGMERGSPPAIDGWSLERLRPVHEEATARLMQATATDLSPEVRETLTQLAVHEAYHVGQVGLWRRTRGLPGVIGS